MNHPNDINLNQAQQLVDDWIKTIGVRYFNELTNTAILMEEVGELARLMARTYGEQSFKENDKNRDLGDRNGRRAVCCCVCQSNRGKPHRSITEKHRQKNPARRRTVHKGNEKL